MRGLISTIGILLVTLGIILPSFVGAQMIDSTVESVDLFSDIKVEIVDFFADEKWEVVGACSNTPNLKVEFVDLFADIKVEIVDYFSDRKICINNADELDDDLLRKLSLIA